MCIRDRVLATPATDTPPVARLPRQIRIVTPPVVQKMPADANVEEMRILNAEIALAPDASLFKDAAVQVVVTFYDITTDGQMHPTRAITHGPALITGGVLSGGKPYPVQATYVAVSYTHLQPRRRAGVAGYGVGGQFTGGADGDGHANRAGHSKGAQ